MKRIIIVALLFVMMICLTGCASINNGTVKDKSFVPAHRTYQPIIMMQNRHTQIIPRWISHADSWSILVENEDGKEWWNVTEDYYNSVNIGDYIDRRKTDN